MIFHVSFFFILREVQIMPKRDSISIREIDVNHDAIDEYFECITACSIEDEGMQCITQCTEVHLKREEE